jgi:lactate dehydrogenase-like 2-hydroxyacid dehydrogenase
MKKYKIAVLDDYQNVALESADWSTLRDRADIAVFQDHLADPDAVVERLLPFDVVCVMRERTPLPRNIIERLPNLKLIASTGSGNSSIDLAAAGDHGIVVVHTGYWSDPTIEFTWALISEHPMRSRRSRYFSPVTIAATLRERNCSSTAVSRKSNLYETSK